MNTEQKIIKRPLVFDVDDVVLNSGQTIIKIINEKYNLSPKLKVENIKDWNFTYLKREIKRQKGIVLYTEDFLKIFETSEFWKEVEINKEIIEIIHSPLIQQYFMITFVSTGTKINLKLKEEYLRNHLDMYGIRYLGIPIDKEKNDFTKKELDNYMSLWGGIQIDDNYNCLNTNAKLKILLKNNKDTTYNEVLDLREDLYIINELNDLKEILFFIIETEDFFKDFKSIPLV